MRLDTSPDSFLPIDPPQDPLRCPPHNPSQDIRPRPLGSSAQAISSTTAERDLYLNNLSSANTKLELAFDQNLTVNSEGLVLPKKVVALLLYFDMGSTDMDCEPEVKELEKTLKDFYRYKVCCQVIETGQGVDSQAAFNKYLADFVYHESGVDTLLIVYYAGHGWHGNGQLKLMPRTDGQEFDRITWEYAEAALMTAKASVLVILDCCDAGSITRRRGSEPPFEYIAAASWNDPTRTPGQDSFTSALIWALKKLADEKGGFTASALANKIGNAPELPKNQCPGHGDRKFQSQGKVALAPLPKVGTPLPKVFDKRTPGINGTPIEYVDIRFPLTRRPTEGETARFSSEMSKAITLSGLPTSIPRWRGLEPWETGDREEQLGRPFYMVAEIAGLRFRNGIMKRKLSSLEGSSRPSPASLFTGSGVVPQLQVPQPPEMKVHVNAPSGNRLFRSLTFAANQRIVLGLAIISAFGSIALGLIWKL
ncbi:MAG: hypothetical protein M1814_000037 [Vezdaea aestivalis]|nr:MAG: hypothetical protein M1814_000037 [Vezdaea aestivalis]